MAFVVGWSGLVYASVHNIETQPLQYSEHSIQHKIPPEHVLSPKQDIAVHAEVSQGEIAHDCHEVHQHSHHSDTSMKLNHCEHGNHQDCRHVLIPSQMSALDHSSAKVQVTFYTYYSGEHLHFVQQNSVDHGNCQECSPTHCQTVNAHYLNAPALSLNFLITDWDSAHVKSDVQVQHHVGFWQEIIRPPKA